jgi:hypothetical protein
LFNDFTVALNSGRLFEPLGIAFFGSADDPPNKPNEQGARNGAFNEENPETTFDHAACSLLVVP